MATDTRETATLQQAAEILTAAPFAYRSVTVEYPGFLLVAISDDDEDRYYAAGFANDTLTVHRDYPDGDTRSCPSVDTKVLCVELDGYRMAIHVAAAIDRLEHEGEQL